MRESSPNTPKCFVTQIDPSCVEKFKNDLISQGFELSKPQYTHFLAQKKGLSCALYLSGKLTVQGKDMKEFIEFYLEPEILLHTAFTNPQLDVNFSPHIGVDESGKGDFFGPLCTAGLFADEGKIQRLLELGVKDSKTMSDKTIAQMAATLRKEFVYHTICINPKRYNELYSQFRNLNQLLGWAHATVIEQLVEKTGCQSALIDQFASEYVVTSALKRKGIAVSLTQRHRAEEDVVVAGASILARDSFVQQLAQLSKEYQCELPKGAAPLTIKKGKELVARYGKDILQYVAKLHFKTTDRVLDNN